MSIDREELAELSIRFYDELDPWQFSSDLYDQYGSNNHEKNLIKYRKEFRNDRFLHDQIYNLNCIRDVDRSLFEEPNFVALFNDYYNALNECLSGTDLLYGMFINCRKYQFIRWILDGKKLYETRNRDMLHDLVGKRVALIQTGKGEPVVMGYATVTSSHRSNSKRDRNKAMITDTDFDCKDGKQKVFYRLENVQECVPFSLPDSAVRHGRSWVEF